MNNKHKIKLRGGNHDGKVLESTHVEGLILTMPSYNKMLDAYEFSGEHFKEKTETIYIFNLTGQKPVE